VYKFDGVVISNEAVIRVERGFMWCLWV